MSRPPVSKSLYNCMEKVRYSDELGARAAASCLCDSFHCDELYVYKCPHCAGWHATSKVKGDIQREKVTPDDPFIQDHRHEYGKDGKCTICRKKNPGIEAEEIAARWRARYDELIANHKEEAAKKCLDMCLSFERKARIIKDKIEASNHPMQTSGV